MSKKTARFFWMHYEAIKVDKLMVNPDDKTGARQVSGDMLMETKDGKFINKMLATATICKAGKFENARLLTIQELSEGDYKDFIEVNKDFENMLAEKMGGAETKSTKTNGNSPLKKA